MIVPITRLVRGEDQAIGAVSVSSDGEAEFYLKPGFSIADSVKAEMVKQIKKRAKKNRG
jgi:hypothetical protein